MKIFSTANILILNRSVTTAENLKRLFVLMGFKEHKIYSCYSPEAALSAYYPVKFDLVITEHRFPQCHLSSTEIVKEIEIKGTTCRNATFIVLNDRPIPELGFNSHIDDVIEMTGAATEHLQEVVKKSCKAYLLRQKIRPLGLARESEPLGDLINKCNQVEIKYPELFYSIQKYRGNFFSAHGRHDVTVNLYRSMISRLNEGTDDSWLYEVLISALINNGQTEEAEKTFKNMSKGKTSLPPQLVEAEAQILLSKADIAGAIEKYELLASQIDLDMERVRLLGHMYLFVKNFEKCLESYLHAGQMAEGSSRTKLENQLLYIRALLYVRSNCNDSQIVYKKKFDLEVNRIEKRKYTLEDKIKLSIIELQALIFKGNLTAALAKIGGIIPILSNVDSSTKAHFLSILDDLMLEKEFAYIYQKIECNDDRLSNMEKNINEQLIEQRVREHKMRKSESREIASQIEREMATGSMLKACEICLNGYQTYPYSQRIGLQFLNILTETEPENIGKKQLKELVTSIGQRVLPLLKKESDERVNAEHSFKLVYEKYC